MKRSAGILMPIFSLPSKYGIGTMGYEAYKFIDFLKQANQSYWQILPIGPTSYGDSPYSTFSIYAGNPYFIDLDLLVKEKMLTISDLKKIKVKNIEKVDYGYLYKNRLGILYKAYQTGKNLDVISFNKFKNENSFWLDDYSFFMALKKHFNMLSWLEWPDNDIRLRKAKAIDKYKELLKDDIEFFSFLQYLFYKQFYSLKEYANENNIKLIGDIPIYVPLDSSDCWSNPENFVLDENYIPKEVSGVPPDFFNENGQLWGNPLYNWKYMKKNGYKWWTDRIRQASKIYDIIRIDHFRGFESYWAVKYGEENAINGRWIKGPNMDLLDKLKKSFKNVEFIAEDLGFHTKEVQKMLDNFGFPGMKVLEFSFDSRDNNGAEPFNYPENSVCYVGTHDNSTAYGFLKEADKNDIAYCKEYLNISNNSNFNWKLIKGGMESNSYLFICQMQDYLGLDDSSRINMPGTIGKNWKWRMKPNVLTKNLAKKISKYTIMYGRANNL